jgi:predicted phosphoadenosine phosphosulfate sulfurtransferase
MKTLRKRTIDRTVYDLALERINTAFDLFDTVTVSFSGGKDSTVCLNLALQVARERGKLPLRAFFFDEEAIPYQTEEYVRRVSHLPDVALEWYCLPVQHRNACSRAYPFWSPWDPEERDLWVRPLPPEARTALAGFETGGTPMTRLTIPQANGLLFPPETSGRAAVLMGIRAQESMTRYRAVARRHQENYIIPYQDKTSQGNVWKVYPIYDWATEDVWTAPALFGWDYNRAYDVMDQCGIPPGKQRCSPAYGEEPMSGFFLFKSCFPEIWDRMSRRVPGANTALLYARTDLYGYGGFPEKPADMPWQDFITHYIEKFPPQVRKIVIARVRRCLREHFQKTTDPLLSHVPHPITGACWDRIANIAIRGDFKGRRTQNLINNSLLQRTQDWEAAWERYHQARAEEGL